MGFCTVYCGEISAANECILLKRPTNHKRYSVLRTALLRGCVQTILVLDGTHAVPVLCELQYKKKLTNIQLAPGTTHL